MLNRVVYVVKKLKRQGRWWFVRRLRQEAYAPQTQLGTWLKPLIGPAFSVLSSVSNKIHFLFTKSKLRSKDTLFFFYDLDVCPVTFDFCWALAIANMRRETLNLKKLHVVFVPGRQGGLREETPDYETAVDQHAREWRRSAILHSITELLPACNSVINCGTREEAMLLREQTAYYVYPEGYNVTLPVAHRVRDGLQAHTAMLAFRAPPQALRYVEQWLASRAKNRKVIVITLRQSSYMPARNSQLNEWVAFAKQLDPNEYFVVFVPDVEAAMDPQPSLENFTLFNEACWSVKLRAALYENAYLNLAVNNGPLALCWFNERCRYIMFKMVTEEVPQTSSQAMAKHGFKPGVSPPFVRPHQKWIWEDDNAALIQREFSALSQRIEHDLRKMPCKSTVK